MKYLLEYRQKMNDISNQYHFEYTYNDVDPKDIHRLKCFSSNKIIKNIIIDNFGDISNLKETILIEFRPFIHLEFLLRNTILKLKKWNHTIVCGNLNYPLIKKICKKICYYSKTKINIIKMDINNVTPSEYSKLLTSIDFWNMFNGEKLLIYQEDSMLFHNNIEEFLKYDYIGAPWPIDQDDNLKGVGNGGFSLRSKSKLIQCIEIINPNHLKLGQSTKKYMLSTDSDFVPEDVYFSKSMIDFNIGLVADRITARRFSQESQISHNPVGGHNFWLAGNNLEHMYSKNFYLTTTKYFESVNHCFGWKLVINQSIRNHVLCKHKNSNNINLIDCMEQFFLWNDQSIQHDWYGIIHYCNNLPSFYTKNERIDGIIEKIIQNNSIKFCKGIIVLSNYSQKIVNNIFHKLNYQIPVYPLKHPIPIINNKFSIKKFKEQKTYKIIQLGIQYRKVSTIFTIQSKYEKIWLSGANSHKRTKILSRELKYLNINKTNNVSVLERVSNCNYLDLILNNIVTIPLWDASANNSLIECFEMNIPAFISPVK